MTFLSPEFIYLMLLPAGLLVYLITTNKDALERVFDEKVLERLRIGGDALGRHGHNTLIFLAFFLMTLALARPVIEQGEEVVRLKGVDTVVALDLSLSMKAKDFYPDRLAFAKQKVAELLPDLPAGRVGLLGFSSGAFIVAPPTTDRDALLFLLRRLDESSADARGTDLMAALKGAAKLLKEGGVVLLVTDGGDGKAMAPLVDFARAYGLKVVVWMVATQRGAPIPGNLLPEGKKDSTVLTRANTALATLAKESGGLYVPATLSQQDEARIVRWFEGLHEKAKSYEKVVQKRIELFYYPLALALLVLPFALYSMGGRKVLGAVAAVVVLALPKPAEAGLMDFALIEKGVSAYRAGDFKTSVDAFEKLAMRSPKPEVWLDLGDAYYKMGRFKMACDAYSRVVTKDLRLESAKLYNLGNCYARLGELQKAAAFYEKVLRIWDDPDARHNLQVVKEAMKRRPKPKSGGKAGEKERNERRDAKGEGAEASEERSQTPGVSEAKAKRRKISAFEERKWMELIESQPLKAKLYPLTPPTKKSDANPW
ncbi:vWA domain-containing protein [Hydrogenimonas sp.]